ncbi:hypothetical protein BU17DRAFT_77825 [Hysterangium stoloniferum]|nr:hypothetical protein BU17DRAFT_77825 [Hysterangium stoloniferum]
MSKATIEDLVNDWLRLDKEETTRNEIQRLWEKQDISALEDRLSLIVIQASQGLAAYVLREIPEAKTKGVVIGHDHRHNSKHWAMLTTAAFLSFGFNVYPLVGLVHTPLVPFSVSMLGASCGIMITASHNPRDDNGYKVYWENAVQIIAPHDEGIAQAINENLEPRVWDMQTFEGSSLVHDKTEKMKSTYFSYLAGMELNSSAPLKFISTPMHGVGHDYVAMAFEAFGFPPFIAVERQKQPDPNFPTDIALEDGNKMNANYVLAQDPDADRFTAAEKWQVISHLHVGGEWKVFSGDMLGIVFAARIFDLYKASGKPLNKLAMVASTVSSKMLAAMAKKEGFKFIDCLTGFKYIGNTALDLTMEGYDVPFAYEEAIGFMIGSVIRDKDGISATVFFAELAADLHRRGSTVAKYLFDLYSKYGYFETRNSYFICRSPATIDSIFSRLRNYNAETIKKDHNYPREIGGLPIVWIRDLTKGYEYDSGRPPTCLPALPLSSGHMIQFRAESTSGEGSITLTLRTSGTEPKIKYYLEGNGPDDNMVREILSGVVQVLITDWVQAERNQLDIPLL